jgi:hypothetical protein
MKPLPRLALPLQLARLSLLLPPNAYLFVQFTAYHFSVADVSTNTISLLVRVNEFLLAIYIDSDLRRCGLGGLLSVGNFGLFVRLRLPCTHADSGTAILARLCYRPGGFSLTATSSRRCRPFGRGVQGGRLTGRDGGS